MQLPLGQRDLLRRTVHVEQAGFEPELSQEVTITSIIRERDGIPLSGAFPRRAGLDPPLAVIAAAPARLSRRHPRSPARVGSRRQRSRSWNRCRKAYAWCSPSAALRA